MLASPQTFTILALSLILPQDTASSGFAPAFMKKTKNDPNLTFMLIITLANIAGKFNGGKLYKPPLSYTVHGTTDWSIRHCIHVKWCKDPVIRFSFYIFDVIFFVVLMHFYRHTIEIMEAYNDHS